MVLTKKNQQNNSNNSSSNNSSSSSSSSASTVNVSNFVKTKSAAAHNSANTAAAAATVAASNVNNSGNSNNRVWTVLAVICALLAYFVFFDSSARDSALQANFPSAHHQQSQQQQHPSLSVNGDDDSAPELHQQELPQQQQQQKQQQHPRMSLTSDDIAQIKARGSTVEEVERQLKAFRDGFQFTRITRPATTGDGILKLSEQELEDAVQLFDKEAAQLRCVKFVPASGAASRMFKSLFSFLETYDKESQRAALMAALDAGKPADVAKFFSQLKQFAFYADLDSVMQDVGGVEKALAERRHGDVLRYLLTDVGLNYGDRPKGLLRFHTYVGADGSVERRVPIEEHLVEGAQHCRRADGTVLLHFTVSPSHLADFKAMLELVRATYEARFDCRYVVSYSEQKPSTDTISVDMQNKPFRTDDNQLLFRPAGHGALIENLNDIDADIVFIKNIDNVVPDSIKPTTIRYKKGLGGVLLRLRRRIDAYTSALENDGTTAVSDARLGEIATFIASELGTSPPARLVGAPRAQRVQYYLEKLRRPLRACGMVPNAGETGGGPFWTQTADGGMSIQIVETAQINVSDATQASVMASATHFNPVDLACATKKRDGTRYALPKHVDHTAGFISTKSLNGRELKAQELPGLWNGAMADWNTIFVEVPLITFNPVKVVNDLLRPEHIDGSASSKQ